MRVVPILRTVYQFSFNIFITVSEKIHSLEDVNKKNVKNGRFFNELKEMVLNSPIGSNSHPTEEHTHVSLDPGIISKLFSIQPVAREIQ